MPRGVGGEAGGPGADCGTWGLNQASLGQWGAGGIGTQHSWGHGRTLAKAHLSLAELVPTGTSSHLDLLEPFAEWGRSSG